MSARPRSNTFVYVAIAESGHIARFRLDGDTGALQAMTTVAAGKAVMPMAISRDRRFLYAHVRSQSRDVFAYAIDANSGDLDLLARAPLPESASYISIDRTGRFLLSVSYAAATVAVNPIAPDGRVGAEPVQVLPVGPKPHAILADPSNRFVFVPVLGGDDMLQFIFDDTTGRLSPNTPSSVGLPPGTNPRHFRFAPDGGYVYVLSESRGAVHRLVFDAATGLLTATEAVSGVPAHFGLVPGRPRAPIDPTGKAVPVAADTGRQIWAADIHITPDGRFVYASERTSNTLAAFAVDPTDGRLTYLDSVPSEAQARGFAIDPRGDFLVCSGEKSTDLAVYRIDRTSGRLTQLNRYPVGLTGNWVEIVDLP